jgi:adenylyltransferase/sulfurtransferase
MTLNDQDLERYARHIVLKEIGGQGQQQLLNSKVLVIGAGGLGSPLLMYLAAAGVGTIGIVDDDEVTLSNLQRQILYTTEAVGMAKTASAGKTLEALNPGIKVIPHAVRLTPENADAIIKGYDLVADGCDNFETRLAVSDACTKARKPLVSAAILRFDGQLSTFKPHVKDANGKPLPCYRCLVPEAPPAEGLNCADVGVLGAIAGVMGTLQGVEVVKELLGMGTSLAGRVLIYDGLTADFRTVKLPKDPTCPGCSGA